MSNDSHRLEFDGRYGNIGTVKKSDKVSLLFPISERNEKLYPQKERYDVVIRGNEIVDIDPPGRYHPIYLRNNNRVNEIRWFKINLFVADKVVPWSANPRRY